MNEDRPNIVLLTADALRADHLGCYGYRRDTSPVLDAFDQESLRFTNAYTARVRIPGRRCQRYSRVSTQMSRLGQTIGSRPTPWRRRSPRPGSRRRRDSTRTRLCPERTGSTEDSTPSTTISISVSTNSSRSHSAPSISSATATTLGPPRSTSDRWVDRLTVGRRAVLPVEPLYGHAWSL